MRTALSVLVASVTTSCSASRPPEPAAVIDAPKVAPPASATVEPEELTQPRGLGEDAMCFNAKYSPEALASQSSELLQSECEAMGCCNHLLGLQGKPLPDSDWRRALLQSASLGRYMALMARGRTSLELTLPATQLASRGTLDSTIIRSCGSWSACGYFVRHWYSRLSSGLATPLTAASCAIQSDDLCADAASKVPEAERFTAWYQCIDASRPFFFDVRELGDERDLGVPRRPRQGYLLARSSDGRGAFNTTLYGTKQALRIDEDGLVSKWEVGCEEVDEALWVSQVVAALSPRRAARDVAVPEPMLQVAHRAYPAPALRDSTLDEAPYHWLAASDVGRARWVEGRGACEQSVAYRTLRVADVLRPRRESLVRGGRVGGQYSLAALKCISSKPSSDGCAEFERLMKPLWGKRVCRELP